jgi:stage V sporulation protein G
MKITEVRVRLMEAMTGRLQAVGSITIDGSFVVRDIKVLKNSEGYFVSMPTRKLTDHCPRCDEKNHLRARFCNNCGARLSEYRAERDDFGRARLYDDIAHPINQECRLRIQDAVLAEFHDQLGVASQCRQAPEGDEAGRVGSGVGEEAASRVVLESKEGQTASDYHCGGGLF